MPVKLKKGSKAAKDYMAKIRAMRKDGAGKHTDTKSHNVNVKVVSGTKKKSATRQTGTSVKTKDKKRSALAPGKRTIGKGKSKHSYYERRANRSDKPGSLTGIGSTIYNVRDQIEKELKYSVRQFDILKEKKKNKELTDPFHKKLFVRYPAYIRSLKKSLSDQNKLINQSLK